MALASCADLPPEYDVQMCTAINGGLAADTRAAALAELVEAELQAKHRSRL